MQRLVSQVGSNRSIVRVHYPLKGQQEASLSTGIRRRPRFHRPEYANAQPDQFGALDAPFTPAENTMDEYLKKTSLSPWVPLPDVAIRKIFDLVDAGPDDTHVDLGSGDGRVCFQALQYGVGSSYGIDVDAKIVKVAKERLAKRHPKPNNIGFAVADLLDTTHKVWETIQQATILTMYFTTDALEKLRPVLEAKLTGRRCQIVAAGYAVPGWEAHQYETVLGTQINVYQWGMMEAEDDDGDLLFAGPAVLESSETHGFEQSKPQFDGANVLDKTGKFQIRGFNPDIFTSDEEEEDWSTAKDQ